MESSPLKSVKGQSVDELHSFVCANKPDIITLSESWLDCSISSNEGWLPLTERWAFHKCLQVFHCINGFFPSYLLNLFSCNSDVHNNYNTRGCSKIHLEIWKPGNAISSILASNSVLNTDWVTTVTTQNLIWKVTGDDLGSRRQNSLVVGFYWNPWLVVSGL